MAEVFFCFEPEFRKAPRVGNGFPLFQFENVFIRTSLLQLSRNPIIGVGVWPMSRLDEQSAGEHCSIIAKRSAHLEIAVEGRLVRLHRVDR